MPIDTLNTLYQYKVKEILKVVDGDTVDVIIDLGFDVFLEKRVRMAGVNAPESRTRNLEEKAKGLKTKAWLIEKFNTEEQIIIETSLDNQYGKFGRVLGTFYVGDSLMSVNLEMLSEGLARPYMIEDFPNLMDGLEQQSQP
jgi:endonuclease YncB( thermonuclease family)